MDRRAQIDERIKDLLLSTDLTFKAIIETLKRENMSASFNTIRRVNRNHRYRKPRYDAKLTPSQRKELIVRLKNTKKPNLSSLAREYGVCHGSIWYWWDKLSKIREQNNGIIPDNEPSLEFDDGIDQEFLTSNVRSTNALKKVKRYNEEAELETGEDVADVIDDDAQDFGAYGYPESDPLDLDDNNQNQNNNNNNHDDDDINDDDDDDDDDGGGDDDYNCDAAKSGEDQRQISQVNINDLELVGPVQAKDALGQFIRLPILMFASSSNQGQWNNRAKAGDLSSRGSSSNSTPSASSSSSSTSSCRSTSSQTKRIRVS